MFVTVWFVKLCNVVVGYRRFRDQCCLHLQGILPQHHKAS